MTTLFKGASAAALAGTGAAGGIYFGTDLFKAEEVKKVSISSLIRDANPEKRLITATTVGDADWKAAYKTYIERNKDNEKDIWSLKGWSKPVGEVTLTEATQEFLSACDSNSKVEVSEKEDPLYQQVLSYCTRNTLVSDLIKERSNGKQLLDTSSSGSGQEEEWKAAWGVYRTQNKDSGNGKNPWGINNWETEKEKEELPSDYKSKCAERVKKPAHKFDNEDYVNVLAWCTK
ncbi:hypothetical protein HF1_03060 [Mycoplasma haemofelis str. Langford 1]|uniref:Uncharacterized protein n=1 Tax=Mycoplasma haemofelis (strain Langford 1) TaxID=941640 RepID=E8ZGP3_MYCHL|nr:hypothetical protein [Mycoplasma haemofelis]CBY92314.1 hypothetical protein HF1_03060 [Mycoplasma haemofelis str. Langford 1]